jgi:hypothetical protein
VKLLHYLLLPLSVLVALASAAWADLTRKADDDRENDAAWRQG